MYYSDELIEEVRAANDIVDVIGQYVRLNRNGSRYVGLCPFHSEKTPSFSVSPDTQMYYCFGCHAGGSVFTFLMQYENATFPEAVKSLADRAGIALPEQEPTAEDRRELDLRSRICEINMEAARYFYYRMKQDRDQRAHRYLLDRGLTDETIDSFGLGYAAPYRDDLYKYLKGRGYSDEVLAETGLVRITEQECTDKFWNRVMFPIKDVSGKVTGFGGRLLGSGEPKYMNTPETRVFDKSHSLYGLNIARTAREPYIIVCEGYMDVIALHQAGFRNTVACLGTAMTQGHAMLLKRYTGQVMLMYDDDEAGAGATLRAISVLKEVGLPARVVSLKPYNDPDDFIRALGPDELKERISEAVGSFLYETDRLYIQYDMSDPASKTAFHREIADRLCEFPVELERENYLEAVCERYHIPEDSMRKLVAEEARKAGSWSVRHESSSPRESGDAQPQTTASGKHDREDPVLLSQRLLITGLIDHPEFFDRVRSLISPRDFSGELYRKVAMEVWDQLDRGIVNPVLIVDRFINDADEYREVASMFNTRFDRQMTDTEQVKAFEETVIRVKRCSLDEAARHASDVTELQNILKEQKGLQSFHLK